jgi:signal transduction histidine kinase
MRRLTIRMRLTLLWGALFLAAGTVLLGLTYVLVQERTGDAVTVTGNRFVGVPGEGAGPDHTVAGVDGTFASPLPEDLRKTLQQQVDDSRRRTLNSLLTQGGIALAVVAVVGMGFGWLMAERALRPLARITDTARRVADRNLHERIALTGPADEIKELADTFDSMLERLDQAFDGQRRFVGNASHELRTPLAINRTLLEVALTRPDTPPQTQHLAETLLAVNARHERLIDGLLTLAQSQQALTTRDPLDLADLAKHAVDSVTAHGPELLSDLDNAPVTGDAVLLERIALNLVHNAVAYNVADHGWVSVRTRRTARGEAELMVVNTGPVITAYEVPALFEPFRRLKDRVGSAQGTGLGLSIVRSVAQAHGGTAAAHPRDGGGLVVTVTLPAP